MAPSFLAMKTGAASGASEAAQALLESDLRELGLAARKLANHAIVLGGGLGFGRHFLKWLAFIAAVSVFTTSPPLSSLLFSLLGRALVSAKERGSPISLAI